VEHRLTEVFLVFGCVCVVVKLLRPLPDQRHPDFPEEEDAEGNDRENAENVGDPSRNRELETQTLEGNEGVSARSIGAPWAHLSPTPLARDEPVLTT
jgi:hypothetical protein